MVILYIWYTLLPVRLAERMYRLDLTDRSVPVLIVYAYGVSYRIRCACLSVSN